jgi:uncharacterized protein
MKRLNQIFCLAGLALVIAGCASAPSKFYTLNATAKGDGQSSANLAIFVGPVSLPAAVDRPQFTVQLAPNRVAVDEFNRWAEPLKENVARVVAADLATLLGTPRVTSVLMVNFNPDFRVAVDVQKFISEPGKVAQLDALWVISKTGGGTISGHTSAVERLTDNNYDAIAAAHSRALEKLSTDIAAAIRATEK